MFHKVLHAFMQRFLMRVPEMQRFAFRLLAISASKFERFPTISRAIRLLLQA